MVRLDAHWPAREFEVVNHNKAMMFSGIPSLVDIRGSTVAFHAPVTVVDFARSRGSEW